MRQADPASNTCIINTHVQLMLKFYFLTSVYFKELALETGKPDAKIFCGIPPSSQLGEANGSSRAAMATDAFEAINNIF